MFYLSIGIINVAILSDSILPNEWYQLVSHFLFVFFVAFQTFFEDSLFVIDPYCNDWNIC